ncbi:HDOD domain-containing protein [Agarilytica rhodophyticola]|uniref:HDOD domain-containing protein n=1 Tax=Agarilytica rhodophyticola TaxID=1737490 RepID=UPI000B347B18|nr:HDOD domain-containing protein [Agarilytica rhodophyticola]
MKILFVDDEQMILDGIERNLFDSDWEVEVACGGEEALEMLADEDFDVIVSDMLMPKINGVELLSEASKIQPHLVKIVLSGHADQDMSMQAGFVAHQWLDKPCDEKVLMETLSHIEEGLANQPNHSIKKAVSNANVLPTPPVTFTKIKKILSNDGENLDGVADLISQDTPLTAKVLQLTNSSFFSRGKTIYDVREAIVRLGVELVNSIVLLTETYANLPNNKDINFIEEQEKCLLISSLVVHMVSPEQREAAILTALLHQIGKLLLLQVFPEKAEQYSGILKANSYSELKELEEEVFDTNHGKVGAYLLFLWGFPDEIVEGVAKHQDKEHLINSDFGISAAVFLSHMLIERKKIDDDFVEELKITESLSKWEKIANQILSDA